MKYLIVGLGNVGNEYANTRHNIGFDVVDALAEESEEIFSVEKYCMLSRVKYKGRTLLLLKPTTYMNLSGKAVKYWLEKESIPMENLIIIVDDIALPIGAIRIKAKGGEGGHNGLISIIETLNTQEFLRMRIGIGNDFAKGYQSNYVLSRWTKEEQTLLIPRIKLATDAVKSFVTIGPDRTMNFFNNK